MGNKLPKERTQSLKARRFSFRRGESVFKVKELSIVEVPDEVCSEEHTDVMGELPSSYLLSSSAAKHRISVRPSSRRRLPTARQRTSVYAVEDSSEHLTVDSDGLSSSPFSHSSSASLSRFTPDHSFRYGKDLDFNEAISTDSALSRSVYQPEVLSRPSVAHKPRPHTMISTLSPSVLDELARSPSMKRNRNLDVFDNLNVSNEDLSVDRSKVSRPSPRILNKGKVRLPLSHDESSNVDGSANDVSDIPEDHKKIISSKDTPTAHPRKFAQAKESGSAETLPDGRQEVHLKSSLGSKTPRDRSDQRYKTAPVPSTLSPSFLVSNAPRPRLQDKSLQDVSSERNFPSSVSQSFRIERPFENKRELLKTTEKLHPMREVSFKDGGEMKRSTQDNSSTEWLDKVARVTKNKELSDVSSSEVSSSADSVSSVPTSGTTNSVLLAKFPASTPTVSKSECPVVSLKPVQKTNSTLVLCHSDQSKDTKYVTSSALKDKVVRDSVMSDKSSDGKIHVLRPSSDDKLIETADTTTLGLPKGPISSLKLSGNSFLRPSSCVVVASDSVTKSNEVESSKPHSTVSFQSSVFKPATTVFTGNHLTSISSPEVSRKDITSLDNTHYSKVQTSPVVATQKSEDGKPELELYSNNRSDDKTKISDVEMRPVTNVIPSVLRSADHSGGLSRGKVDVKSFISTTSIKNVVPFSHNDVKPNYVASLSKSDNVSVTSSSVDCVKSVAITSSVRSEVKPISVTSCVRSEPKSAAVTNSFPKNNVKSFPVTVSSKNDNNPIVVTSAVKSRVRPLIASSFKNDEVKPIMSTSFHKSEGVSLASSTKSEVKSPVVTQSTRSDVHSIFVTSSGKNVIEPITVTSSSKMITNDNMLHGSTMDDADPDAGLSVQDRLKKWKFLEATS